MSKKIKKPFLQLTSYLPRIRPFFGGKVLFATETKTKVPALTKGPIFRVKNFRKGLRELARPQRTRCRNTDVDNESDRSQPRQLGTANS